jgi:hypothetical protein
MNHVAYRGPGPATQDGFPLLTSGIPTGVARNRKARRRPGRVLMVAKGTPAAIVAALNREMATMLGQPDVRAKMLAMDL